MRAACGLLEFSLIGQEVSGMATHKPIKWARVAKVAGAVVAGVLAVAAGAIPAWNWHVAIRPQPPRDGSHEEAGEDQGQSGQES
jgi:hypothetical protein